MPEPASPPKVEPKGKGKAKGLGKGLSKRIGPFPLFVWLGIGAGGLLILFLVLRSKGEGGDSGFGVGPELVSGSRTASPQEQAYAGAPSENGSMATQISPDVLGALESLGAQIGDVRGHVTEIEDAYTRTGYQIQPDKSWLPPELPGDAVVSATLGPPGSGIVRKPPGPVRPSGSKKPPVRKPPNKPPKKKAAPKRAPVRTAPKQKVRPKPKPVKKPVGKRALPKRGGGGARYSGGAVAQ